MKVVSVLKYEALAFDLEGNGPEINAVLNKWANRNLAAASYRLVKIPKAKGGFRYLEIPSPNLLDAQRKLAWTMSKRAILTGPACAYTPGRNVVVHAAAHGHAREIVQIDIRDFFHNVRPHHVHDSIFTEEEHKVALNGRFAGIYLPHLDQIGREALLSICFRERGGRLSLAQGAPTSPLLSNLAAARLDHSIRTWGNENFGVSNWTYTRYADDIVLSVNIRTSDFKRATVEFVSNVLERNQWCLHPDKTKYWNVAMNTNPAICGIVLAGEQGARRPALNREIRRRARAAARNISFIQHDLIPNRRLERERGTLSWAYSVTGDLRILGLTSKRVRRLARQLTDVFNCDEDSIVQGWLENLPGTKVPPKTQV